RHPSRLVTLQPLRRHGVATVAGARVTVARARVGDGGDELLAATCTPARLAADGPARPGSAIRTNVPQRPSAIRDGRTRGPHHARRNLRCEHRAGEEAGPHKVRNTTCTPPLF